MSLRDSVVSLVAGKEIQELNSLKAIPKFDNLVYTKSFELANKKGYKISSDGEAPVSQRVTPAISRVPKENLEWAYIRESTVFNGINKTVQVIMSSGYKFIGDKKSVAFFEDFFRQVGSRGGETEWDEMYASIFKHQLVYGDAWVEKIPAIGDNEKIVDLELIDPKTMDLARDASKYYVLDQNMNPMGYVQSLPPYLYVRQKYNVPPNVTLLAGQLFIPTEKVAHFKLYELGDRFSGVGLIEPAWDAIHRKIELEKANANSAKRMGFPTRRIEVGDAMHEPTEEQIQRALEQITNTDNMGVFAHPYWVKVYIDESKSPEKLQRQLDYYIDQIVAAMGMPRSFITGGGEATNRSTLNRQEYLFKLSLREIIERTNRNLEKLVIEPVAYSNGVNPVRILWNEIVLEELDARAVRITKYAQAGIITPDDKLEESIRSIEDLPEMSTNGRNRNPKPEPNPAE